LWVVGGGDSVLFFELGFIVCEYYNFIVIFIVIMFKLVVVVVNGVVVGVGVLFVFVVDVCLVVESGGFNLVFSVIVLLCDLGVLWWLL